MPVEIRQTIVTPSTEGDAVQLHISDALPGDESATFVLQLTVQLPKSTQVALLEKVQRDALKVADGHLSGILSDLMQKIQRGL